MNRSKTNLRVYEPEILQTTGIAFDAAWGVLRKNCKNQKSKRRELARIIFRFVDEGETDALRICMLALNKFGKPNVQIAKKAARSNPASWNGLRSLPGRNWHVQRAHELLCWIDNRRRANVGLSV